MSSKTANSNESSPSNSISLIRLDELSSFGATKQNRLPALIKLNEIDQNKQVEQQQMVVNSMPTYSGSELEKSAKNSIEGQRSLPAQLSLGGEKMVSIEDTQRTEKENLASVEQRERQADESDDFQVVDMQQEDEEGQLTGVLIGPSLPHVPGKEQQQLSKDQIDKSINALQSSLQLGNSTHLGDSLIEMIINLRDENQNLIRALETNNEYVKERLSEFKRVQEEAKKREAQFAREKADFEHQARKLQRQNSVLSERLKSMEAKLKDMKLEVSESLNAASSSKASSVQGTPPELYPLIDPESFSNAEMANKSSDDDDDPHEATTMQVDATSGELYNNEQQQLSAAELAAMSKEELNQHFDAKKAEFFACDDPMKQCDKLEQQLNDIGKRDYEICLMQQQLNIYRQDFRLERMEKLEAKIQIEKLKNDIDRLCLERLQSSGESGNEQTGAHASGHTSRKFSDGIGRMGHHLTRKAAKQAAKAAKYAAKQAHLEEKAAAALARIQAARAAAAATAQQHQAAYSSGPTELNAQQQAATTPKTSAYEGPAAAGPHHHHHHARHHHRGSGSARHARGSGIRSEVVNDLLSTANKAMLTGYKMASTHVNLALDKLSQYEQQQASQLDKNKQTTTGTPTAATAKPSAPIEYPSID